MSHLDDTERIYVCRLEEGRMAGIARILSERGYDVRGSARRPTPAVASLDETGIDVDIDPDIDSDKAGLEATDLVVHPPQTDDELVDQARRAGLETVAEAPILAEITEPFRTIGVTGTHGRATVSTMVAWILEAAGHRPGFVVSSPSRNFGVEGRDGADRWFVLEVDERLVSHRDLEPDYVVCNFLDLEPGTYYGDDDDIVGSIREFLESNRRLKEVFANLDCRGNRQVVRTSTIRPTGYSLDHKTEFRGETTETEPNLEFEARHRDELIDRFNLRIPGRYNVVNALGALVVGHRLRISSETIAEALDSYEGLQNRYAVSSAAGITIVKDFAAHPRAVGRLVESARRQLDGPLTAVFDPQGEPSLRAESDAYTESFDACDELYVVGDGEDRPDGGLSDEEIEQHLLDELEAGDNVLFVGGDRILRRADHLQAQLAERAGRTRPEGDQPRFDGPLTGGDD